MSPSLIGPWRAANGAKPPRPRQRRGPDQHHAPGGGRGGALGIVHPGKGIELLKEKHEGRHEPAFGTTFAAQFNHQRGEYSLPRQGAGREMLERHRTKGDVGVAKQDKVRELRQAQHMIEAALHRREFAGPAGSGTVRGQHRQSLRAPFGGGAGSSDLGGAIPAFVVDQNNVESPGKFLRQQRGKALANHIRLVARRDDGGHRYALRRRRAGRRETTVPFGQPPEAAVKNNKVEPDEKAGESKKRESHGDREV